MRSILIAALLMSAPAWAENGGPGIDHPDHGGDAGAHSSAGSGGDPTFVGKVTGTITHTSFSNGPTPGPVTGPVTGSISVSVNNITHTSTQTITGLTGTIGGSVAFSSIGPVSSTSFSVDPTTHGVITNGSFSNMIASGNFVGTLSGNISGGTVSGSFSGGDRCCNGISGNFSSRLAN